MVYTTDYRVENCRTYNFDHENVKVENKSIYDIRFKFVYKSAGTNNSTSTRTYEVSQNKIEIETIIMISSLYINLLDSMVDLYFKPYI